MLDNVIDLNFYPTDEARRSNLSVTGPSAWVSWACRICPLRSQDLPLRVARDARRSWTRTHGVDLLSTRSWPPPSSPSRTRRLPLLRGLQVEPRPAADRHGRPPGGGTGSSGRGLSNLASSTGTPVRRAHPRATACATRTRWPSRRPRPSATSPAAFPCIEPIYKNIYVKANISGEFTVTNAVPDRRTSRSSDLWGPTRCSNGSRPTTASSAGSTEVPDDPEARSTARPSTSIPICAASKLTAVRAKWIDQSQSHNVFRQGHFRQGCCSDHLLRTPGSSGLKTTYYLRSLAVEPDREVDPVEASKFGYTQKRGDAAVAAATEPTG